MLQFKIMIIDYKEDSLEKDENLMQQKAENIREELKTGFNIDPFVNYKMGCHGPLVTIEFESIDKDIKKIFKMIKKNKVYAINIEWREDF